MVEYIQQIQSCVTVRRIQGKRIRQGRRTARAGSVLKVSYELRITCLALALLRKAQRGKAGELRIVFEITVINLNSK